VGLGMGSPWLQTSTGKDELYPSVGLKVSLPRVTEALKLDQLGGSGVRSEPSCLGRHHFAQAQGQSPGANRVAIIGPVRGQ
jgi:hypothetical protein